MKHIIYFFSILTILLLGACKGQKSMVNDQMAKTSMDNTQDQVKPMVKPAADPTESLEKTGEDKPDIRKKPDPEQSLEENNDKPDIRKPADPEKSLVESPVFEKALLWEITGNGLKESSFLYGTIHLIDAESFFWPENTISSYEQTEKIAFEIDLDEMNNIGNLFGMMSKVMMNDGMTLKKLLSEEDYALVNNHFKDMGLPMFMLEKMKPMFLTVFAETDIDMSGGMGNLESSGSKSYEMEFYELAQADEKEVFGLETMDDQISLFDSIPYKDQAVMLVETIKASGEEMPEGEMSEMDKITEMYVQQDINAMVGSIEEEGSEFAGYEDLFLHNRNKNWIPRMTEFMNDSRTFFAVGAGHLGGRLGVIQLLLDEGYTVTPISQKK